MVSETNKIEASHYNIRSDWILNVMAFRNRELFTDIFHLCSSKQFTLLKYAIWKWFWQDLSDTVLLSLYICSFIAESSSWNCWIMLWDLFLTLWAYTISGMHVFQLQWWLNACVLNFELFHTWTSCYTSILLQPSFCLWSAAVIHCLLLIVAWV